MTNTNIAKPTVPMLTVMGGSVLTPKSLGICRQHMKGNGKSKMLAWQLSAEKLAGADTKVLTGLPGNLSPIS